MNAVPTGNRDIVESRMCELFKKQRQSRGLTQIDVAKLIGITQASVSKIEAGTVAPSALSWLRFCNALFLDPRIPMNEAIFSQEIGRLEHEISTSRRPKRRIRAA